MPVNSSYLFKWEDSPGLDHHCGVCHTVLSNPRALYSCMEKSHECFSCCTADAQHHKRHRDILALVREVKKHDANIIAAHMTDERKPRTPILPLLAPMVESNEFTPPAGRSLSLGDNEHLSEDKELPSGEIKPVKSLAPLTHKEMKKARKAAAYAKAIVSDIVTNDDLEFVSQALHSRTHDDRSASIPITEDDDLDNMECVGITEEIVEDNLSFAKFERNTTQIKYQKSLLGVNTTTKANTTQKGSRLRTTARPKDFTAFGAKSSPVSPSVKADPVASIDPKIFQKLKVQVTTAEDSGKKRKELIAKLAAEIAKDLALVGKEDCEAKAREAGFWRFVSRETLTNLKELHEGFSWMTGEIKKPTKMRKSEIKAPVIAEANSEGKDVTALRSEDATMGGNVSNEAKVETLGPMTVSTQPTSLKYWTDDMVGREMRRLFWIFQDAADRMDAIEDYQDSRKKPCTAEQYKRCGAYEKRLLWEQGIAKIKPKTNPNHKYITAIVTLPDKDGNLEEGTWVYPDVDIEGPLPEYDYWACEPEVPLPEAVAKPPTEKPTFKVLHMVNGKAKESEHEQHEPLPSFNHHAHEHKASLPKKTVEKPVAAEGARKVPGIVDNDSKAPMKKSKGTKLPKWTTEDKKPYKPAVPGDCRKLIQKKPVEPTSGYFACLASMEEDDEGSNEEEAFCN